MSESSFRAGRGSYNAEMDRTLAELRNKTKEIEHELIQLKAASRGQHTPEQSAKARLEIIAKAYEDAAESKPFLPSPGSALPSLLALRKAHQNTAEHNDFMKSQATSLEQVQQRIQTEEANLRDQLALGAALQRRVQALRDGMDSKREITQEMIAAERSAELRQKKEHWDKQTSVLLKQLDWFIGHHLGPMLAAEELGGPIVGELTEIEPEDLTAGFSAQGKVRKARAQPDEDKRQRRIDEIWDGVQESEQEQNQRSKRKRGERDEASAAAAEMRDLTEQLLNKLTESGGDSSAAYVKITKESAAARFLVRSKVAELHPKDALRLRLVNFGRELDD
ncbi:hypothetical protein B0H63DRAFT_298430 [Podospora didyma]|uniref:Uncharacterized protein n=1 Tax=Podospora didyma TaxID=330526 RepID=A0AAE0KAL5_9PEZI|nr:hypothetical protein B0H63DRAFT_298430 [Podospora didyma]